MVARNSDRRMVGVRWTPCLRICLGRHNDVNLAVDLLHDDYSRFIQFDDIAPQSFFSILFIFTLNA